MAFAFTARNPRPADGGRKIVTGTFTNGSGDTGGTVKTGLTVIEFASVQKTGSAVATGFPSINSTFTAASGLQSGNFVIKCDDDMDGIWQAYGY